MIGKPCVDVLLVNVLVSDDFCSSESKTTNDFFKSELNYDAVTDPGSFVKDMFQEEVVQTDPHVPDSKSQLTDQMEHNIRKCEVVTSVDRIHTDKQQPSGEVRLRCCNWSSEQVRF